VGRNHQDPLTKLLVFRGFLGAEKKIAMFFRAAVLVGLCACLLGLLDYVVTCKKLRFC
jgi:hypothetical protein